MDIYNIIAFAASLLWGVLAFRQAKGKWGWFFIIYGLTDLIGLFLWWAINIVPSQLYPAQYFLVFFALHYKFFDKAKLYLFPIGFLIVIPTLYLEFNTINTIAFISNILIFLFFLKEFILLLYTENKLNLFFLIFLIFSLVGNTKFLLLSIKVWEGVDLFHMATIFQTIIMIPFLFIRHDDERLSIPLKKKVSAK